MWLPKDERKLLSYYYRQINKVGTGQEFELMDLIRALGKKEQSVPLKTPMKIILGNYSTLENVNNLLSQRNLIMWKNPDPSRITAIYIYMNIPHHKHILKTPVFIF